VIGKLIIVHQTIKLFITHNIDFGGSGDNSDLFSYFVAAITRELLLINKDKYWIFSRIVVYNHKKISLHMIVRKKISKIIPYVKTLIFDI